MYKPPHISSMYFSQDVFIVAVLKSIQLLILKVTQRVLILKLSLRTQQQQIIASFTASSTKRHLVLEGPAGTGKTLVAMQVAKNLLGVSENSDIEPQLVVTSWFPSFDVTNWSPCFGWPQNDSPPLMEYLDTIMGRRVTKICKSWKEVLQEVGVSLTGNVVGETYVKQLLRVSQTLGKRRKGDGTI